MNELEKSDSPTDVDQLLQQNLIMCKKCLYAHKNHNESLEVILISRIKIWLYLSILFFLTEYV